jgi:alpha/beta superfamily hydrolase
MNYPHGTIFFEGPTGRLEAILTVPAEPVTRAAVICHPNPLFGGSMHNKVVYQIGRTFRDAGFAVLRFNFRETGRSEGKHDNGRGEKGDLLAAVGMIERKYPGARICLGGFSFGAAVILQCAAYKDRIAGIIAVGVPVSKSDFTDVARCAKPKLFIQGSQDPFGSVSELSWVFATLKEPKRLKIIESAGHFFEGHLTDLSQGINDFIIEYLDAI